MKTCWFYRVVTLLTADEPSDVPAWVRRHQAHCPACRKRTAGTETIEQALRTTARSDATSAPPFLAQRIVNRLASADHAPRRVTCWQPRLAWAAGVLLVAGLVWREVGNPTTSSLPGREAGPTPWISLQAMTESLPPATSWIEWGDRLDGPLNEELDAVVADARGAVQYLTASFLPASPAAP